MFRISFRNIMVRVTVPGGEEVIFVRLRGGGYKILQDSLFTLGDAIGGGFIMTHEKGAKLYFDSAMQLYRIKNPYGATVAELSYSGGELTAVQGVAGSMALAWQGGLIASVTSSAGMTSTYSYSGGCLTGVTNPDGDTLSYGYDANGFLAESYDFEGGPLLSNTYDAIGRVTAQTLRTADKELHATISYNDADRVNTCVDFDGRAVEYRYGENRDIISITDAEGSKGNGYTKSKATEMSSKEGKTISYTLDPEGRASRVSYPDGTGLEYSYASGNLISSITEILSGAPGAPVYGAVESFTYENNSVTSYTDKNGSTTVYEYNHQGLLVKATDAGGGETEYV